MKRKVSIIIPMYNSEKYIRQCLNSVLEQTFQDMEIIVVDDGSTDRGPAICEEIRLTDERIHLYRQKNGGVSAARNHGIETAEGEFVFFLDSDDAIHPVLIEKLILQAEGQQADIAFCDYRKVNSEQMEAVLKEEPESDTRIQYQTAKDKESEEWFHIKYMSQLSGIGGKLMRRASIGSLLFDTNLLNGEDTFFMYQLICGQVCIVYLQKDWYYYRIHSESVTHSKATIGGEYYFECSRRIREEEYQRGRIDFALTWEKSVRWQMERNYQMLRSAKEQMKCRNLRKIAVEERKHPMFSYLLLSEKILFNLCFLCYPLYKPVNRQIPAMLKWKEAFMMRKEHAEIGIITFHCSNNYGAMLQAFGLKTFLHRNGKKAEIVRYEPIYMTGRHWWIPYVPIKGLKGRIWGAFNMWNGFVAHMRKRKEFARQLSNMNSFRYKYLVNKNQSRILSCRGLKKLKYKYYVVGSDQIWNPDITCGLRKAYFGAFDNKSKKKVISYAASFGGAELLSCHGEKFSKLISHVDAISVREEAAVPYVKRLSRREVTAVLDPVFFLKRGSWQKIEKIPERAANRRYILVYVTEPNQDMAEYVKGLSQETGLPVIEVRAGQQGMTAGFEVDFTAGPSELLGYIHKAEYVVSNSFHAVAFSIIYEKQFLAFLHSNLGARVRNILLLHGLQDRLCEDSKVMDINASVDWEAVRQKTKENVKASGEFLLKNIQG